MLLHKDVRVEHLVVEVVELHGASLKRVLLVAALFLLSLSSRHEDALLEELSSGDHCVGIQLAELLHFLDAQDFVRRVNAGAYIGIPRTGFDQVAQLLAAQTAYFLADLLQLTIFVVHLVLQALRGLFWCCRGQNSEFDV